MIVIDKDKCGGCGTCERICHEHCITLVAGKPTVDPTYCSTCTQCIAVCSQEALSWDGVRAVAYDKSRLPTPEQLDELFKERRTIRCFRQKQVNRTLLEEIIGYGICAPTNNFGLRAIVVDDKETMTQLDQIIVRFSERIYNSFYRPKLVAGLIGRVWPNGDYDQTGPKLVSTIERGCTFDHNASAMVFIVGDRRTPLSEASAQYALANMVYYAQVKGIGSCLWGPGRTFLDRTRSAKELLGVQKQERIYGTVVLGYPEVQFRNKVEGKTLPIHWHPIPRS